MTCAFRDRPQDGWRAVCSQLLSPYCGLAYERCGNRIRITLPALITNDESPASTRISGVTRALPIIAWNALLSLIGLLLIAVTGEIYYRVKLPFVVISKPRHFVKDVGYLYRPHAEVRSTNLSEFWTISRANSLGFLDREPLSPQRTAESCHIAMIGDSFVAASQVPIEAKFHVRLEHEARRKLPNLDVTTSAFGRDATGPVNQLPFYEHYVQHLKPDLLVLAIVHNDFENSSPVLYDEHYPSRQFALTMAHAVRSSTGEIRLVPPRLRAFAELVERAELAAPGIYSRVLSKSFLGQVFYRHMIDRMTAIHSRYSRDESGKCICCSKTSSDRKFSENHDFQMHFLKNDLHGPCKDAFDFLGFALDRFQQMAQRDGASLVVLATDTLRDYPRSEEAADKGYHILARKLTEARGIPFIDLYDYIVRQGGRTDDGRFALDRHWNIQGHQWAAEALLEYLERNQSVCDTYSADAGTP